MPPTKGGKRMALVTPSATALPTAGTATKGRGKRIPPKSGAVPAQPAKGGTSTNAPASHTTRETRSSTSRKRHRSSSSIGIPGTRRSGGKAAPRKSGSAQRPKRRAKRHQRWSAFIYRTLKQVHEKIGMSSRTMTIMGSFVEDMFERLHAESVHVAKINATKTLTAREVQTSARLLLPGELCKHAMSEGTKAVAKYNNAVHTAKMVKAD